MENGIQGTVIISFRVNPDGVVDDVKVLRSVDPSLDREALRVMALFPKWKPAQRNGKSVSSYYVQPFRFYLQQ